MLPTFVRHSDIELVGAADPRPAARAQFEKEFGGRTYDTVAALCDDPAAEAIYIATPHQFHVDHVTLAARAGKHVLVEKPMALTPDDCRRMIDAAAAARIWLIVGHSHSFDAPYLRTRALIDSGLYGPVRMIAAMNYTDFLYRPRRPEELDTAQGGGAVWSQGSHQIDIVRLLAGSPVRSVRAATGRWDPARPTEGAYAAFLTFENGAFATLTYSGYAHFDTDEFNAWSGELGQDRNTRTYGDARARLRTAATPAAEAALKDARAYGTAGVSPAEPGAHNHFGLVVVSCQGADLRPQPTGVMVYADDAASLDPLPPPAVPRAEAVDELVAAIRHGITPLHSGEWGLATTQVCQAILQSADDGMEIVLATSSRAPALNSP